MNAMLGGRRWHLISAVFAGLMLAIGIILVIEFLAEALGLQE